MNLFLRIIIHYSIRSPNREDGVLCVWVRGYVGRAHPSSSLVKECLRDGVESHPPYFGHDYYLVFLRLGEFHNPFLGRPYVLLRVLDNEGCRVPRRVP